MISPYLSAEFCYLDVRIDDDNVGRLVVQLTIPSLLPRHAENFIRLCRGDLVAIDPKATYVGCAFDDTTDYAEYYYYTNTVADGSNTKAITPNGRYRWSHVVRGRNRNAIGRATEPIVDAASVRQCTNAVFGGQYYGDVVYDTTLQQQQPTTAMDDTNRFESPYINATTVGLGIVLAVSVAGPGYGSSRFALVRVAESPREWRQRLLLNSGVILDAWYRDMTWCKHWRVGTTHKAEPRPLLPRLWRRVSWNRNDMQAALAKVVDCIL
jgi:hypothetical protein